VTAFRAGLRLGLSRLTRPSSLVGIGVAFASVALVSLLLRRAAPHSAPDRALTGIALGFVLPLLAYGSVARALGGTRLDASVEELARYGANRRPLALGLSLAPMLVLALGGALLAALAVVVTRAPADPRLASDLAVSSWIGALGGMAYVACFSFGSTFFSRGGGRFWALVLDWTLGAGTTAVALPWPRAHVMNLLGAAPVLAMPQWSATLGLFVLSVGFLALAVWRSPP
jgi:hypothetical protein